MAQQPTCPRAGCGKPLHSDPFVQEGWSCPEHGPINPGFADLKLVTEGDGESKNPMEAMLSWLYPLMQAGTLQYFVSRDPSGRTEHAVVLDNLKLEMPRGLEEFSLEADLVFKFNPATGDITSVRGVCDRRSLYRLIEHLKKED